MEISIYDVLILTNLVGVLMITLARTYNIFHKCEKYDLTKTILMYITFIAVWFIGLIAVLTSPNMLYSILFKFSNLFFALNTIYLFVEIIFHLKLVSLGTIEAYNSMNVAKVEKNKSIYK